MSGNWVKKADNAITVVFIHGFLSSGLTAWSHDNGTTWPKLLADEPELDLIGIFNFSYATGIDSPTYSLSDAASALQMHLKLEKILDSRYIIFVCHSLGGIVARKFLLDQQMMLIERKTEIGLFLVASPSIGSSWANFLSPIAQFFRNSQGKALLFDTSNELLNDLDTSFRNLYSSGRLKIIGKELIEDRPVSLRGLKFLSFFLRPVVESFSGSKYFGNPYKVPKSDHISIAKPEDNQAAQHRILCDFIITAIEDSASIKFANGNQSNELSQRSAGIQKDLISDPIKHTLPLYREIPKLTNELIGRDKELKELLIAVDQHPIVILEGHRGVGKTVLATHALHYLMDKEVFGALIWISAAAAKSEFVLSNVFDAISKTVDYPFSAQTPIEEKEKILKAELSLRNIRCLLLIDNFETVSDPEVKAFLFERLPTNIHVLITSKQREVWPVVKPKIITLEDLSEKESSRLLEYLVERDSAEIETKKESGRLYQVVGGSPLAIEWVIGQVRSGKPFSEILTLLEVGKADILTEVFQQSWTIITEYSQCILRAMTVFVKPPSDIAIKTVSGLPDKNFQSGLVELSQMYLVKRRLIQDPKEIDQQDSFSRYFIHPFTRDYVEGTLSEATKRELFSHAAIFYLEFVLNRGGSVNKEDKNDHLELNTEKPNILHVLKGCDTFGLEEMLIDLVEAMARWLFIESHWSDLEFWGKKAITMAEAKKNHKSAGRITNELGRVYSYQKRYLLAENTFNSAINHAQQAEPVDAWAIAYIKHHKGEAKLRDKDFPAAKLLLTESYQEFAAIDSVREKIGVNYRLAVLAFEQREYSDANIMFENGCNDAINENWDRLEGFHHRYLGELQLMEKKFREARVQFELALELVPPSDMRIQAFIELSLSKLEKEEGRINEALIKSRLATEHFKKIGMVKEEEEARLFVRLLEDLQRQNQKEI